MNVNHDAFEAALHDAWFVVGTVVVFPAVAGAANVVRDNDTVATGAWVTTRVAEAVPAPTVIVPVRAALEVFAAKLAVNVAPLTPEEGERVNHVAFDDALHDA